MILNKAGATLDNVVKAVIYLKDINDFSSCLDYRFGIVRGLAR